MSRIRTRQLVGATALLVGLTSIALPVSGATVQDGRPGVVLQKEPCTVPQPGRYQYFGVINVTPTQENRPGSVPVGFGPADLQSMYQLTHAAMTRGAGQTVAIIGPYDDPVAESVLGVYRAEYGLPACTTANGCFQKVNQRGQPSPLPVANNSFVYSTSMNLDIVSAICPLCHIDLVETNSNRFESLNLGVVTARAIADVVDLDIGSKEARYLTQPKFTAPFDGPGGFVVVTSGYYGYQPFAFYPANLATTTAVGSTSIATADTPRGWHETAVDDPAQDYAGGSGCSKFVPKPAWQTDSGCATRMMDDVSAMGDPLTPAAGYDTDGAPGWFDRGDTGTAIIAGVVGLAENGATISHEYPYSHGKLFDVRSGTNDLEGSCATDHAPKYFCNGLRGYDGPTGLGSPHGYLAF